ncbi:MAG: oligopeptide/dipeptide ABC transporter ATP-binding protein, partial [bacterium]
ADEPTTALDVMVQAQVLDLLTSLVRDAGNAGEAGGMGMVLISHDLGVLGTTCDRIAVMYAGQVVETGAGREIFEHPRHPYTKALAGAFPRIGDAAARFAPVGLPGDPPYPGDIPAGCAFHPRCPIAIDACATTEVPLVDGVRCIRVGS